jgi:hypothetical protein
MTDREPLNLSDQAAEADAAALEEAGIEEHEIAADDRG